MCGGGGGGGGVNIHTRNKLWGAKYSGCIFNWVGGGGGGKYPETALQFC